MPVDQSVSHPLSLGADGGTTRNQEASARLSERHTGREKKRAVLCVTYAERKPSNQDVYQLILEDRGGAAVPHAPTFLSESSAFKKSDLIMSVQILLLVYVIWHGWHLL